MSRSVFFTREFWRFLRELPEVTARECERSDRVEKRLDAVEGQFQLIDQRMAQIESRLDAAEGRFDELRSLRDQDRLHADERLAIVDGRIDGLEKGLSGTVEETALLRDSMLPALHRRVEALLGTMMAEIDEVSAIAERMRLGETIPILDPEEPSKDELSRALEAIQPQLIDAFRGDKEEIVHRLDSHLSGMRAMHSVLDLGCGRGEWLELLRQAGVHARGLEGDPALVQSALRRGLDVENADVLEGLRTIADKTHDGVTAFHLFEHLSVAQIDAVLRQVYRVLEPDGMVVIECPDPRSLRVGGSLFWLDPTHRRPLHPETLALFLKAVGFAVESIEGLHPFPDDQLINSAPLEPAEEWPKELRLVVERMSRMAGRLDEILHGPRDFVIRARKAQH